LTASQQRRAEILSRLEAGALSVAEAADLLGVSARQVRRLRDLADSLGVECETFALRVFDLAGPDSTNAIAEFRQSIARAKILTKSILRCSYGRLRIESSRFNRVIPRQEHLDRLVASLRIAAKIASDEGIILGIENHRDFTGREIANVIEAVGTASIRAALDIGNSFTVFCDPDDDLEALAPYSVLTHLKDLVVVQAEPVRVPFRAQGYALGQGHVDVRRAIQLLVERGPRGKELPLTVETSWIPIEPGADRGAVVRQAFVDSFAYLRGALAELDLWTAEPRVFDAAGPDKPLSTKGR
jgi:sugar phosphate isomerase/epimerase